MKKAIICLLLALVFAVFAEQIVAGIRLATQTMTGKETLQSETVLPTFTEQLGTNVVKDTLDVTLYFRYADTGLLGAQRAQLNIRREETIAMSIVKQLVDGPQAIGGRMSGVFPRGTRVVSVTSEGATAFVTLSRQFLGKPDGAPADWEDLEQWQEEAALRRMLAVQSLVLSLTEDGRYQRVQLYVADTDDDVPMRIPMAYFDVDTQDAVVVLGACSRDESFLLTPSRALERLLINWQKRDWAAMYALLADGKEELPTQDAFVAHMRALDVSLLSYETTNGSVSFDGQRATLVLNAQIRTPDGGDAMISRESVPMHRDADNWAVTYDTLLSLMVRD